MRSFEDYIFDPEEVDWKSAPVTGVSIKPIRDLEDEGILDVALESELHFMKQYQPLLFRTADALAGHMRIKLSGETERLDAATLQALAAIPRHIRQGFALGNITCRRNFVLPLAVGSMYRDISPDTLALIEEAEVLELDMLLDAITVNTEESTAPLRQLTEYELELDRSDPRLEQATTLGAVVCFTLMDYERHRHNENIFTDRSYAEYEMDERTAYSGYAVSTDEAYAQYMSYRGMLDSVPYKIRQVLDWRTSSLRKSGPTRRP